MLAGKNVLLFDEPTRSQSTITIKPLEKSPPLKKPSLLILYKFFLKHRLLLQHPHIVL